MRLADVVALQQLAATATSQYMGPLSPVAPTHPPSLKNPQLVKDDFQEGWRPGDSQAKKKAAKANLKVIMERVLRQAGKPTMARTNDQAMTPGTFYPQAI